MGNNPDRNAGYLIKAIDHISSGEKQAITREWFHRWLGEGKPGREFLRRILKNIHPNVRKRYLARMVATMFFCDPEIIERWMFFYMPAGDDQDMDLMPTPEQINRLEIVGGRYGSRPLFLS